LPEPRFEWFKDKAGKFRFRLKAANGEIIAVGEGYDSKEALINGIELVKRNAPLAKVVPIEEVLKKLNKLDEKVSSLSREVQAVGMKVNGTADMIKKLSHEVATKQDVEDAKRLVLQNQEVFIEKLNRNKSELKKALDKQTEGKINEGERNTLWDMLGKLSTAGGAVQFAEYVKRLIDFMNDKKILQIALPILIKIIFG
jgi:uncharacterized protein YegP (UPF0339 family)